MKPDFVSLTIMHRQRGLSLIELMISIGLGLVVLAALTSVFVNNSANRRDLDRSAVVLENGRYALSVLNSDLALAGYYAGLVTPTGTTALPCSTTVTGWQTSLARPVQGSNHTGASSSDMPCITTRKANTDAIFIQRASSCVAGPTTAAGCTGVTAGAAYLQVSECGDEYLTTPFRLSTDATTLTLRSTVVPTGGTPACSTTAATVAPIRKFYRSIYYVDSANILWRLDIDADSAALPPGTAVQIASGIENMQVEYGSDTNGDGAPDTFASAPADWGQVVGARVSLLVRADSAAPAYTDDKSYFLGDVCSLPSGSACPAPYAASTPIVRTASDQQFKRHVFSSYITFSNIVGRRQQ